MGPRLTFLRKCSFFVTRDLLEKVITHAGPLLTFLRKWSFLSLTGGPNWPSWDSDHISFRTQGPNWPSWESDRILLRTRGPNWPFWCLDLVCDDVAKSRGGGYWKASKWNHIDNLKGVLTSGSWWLAFRHGLQRRSQFRPTNSGNFEHLCFFAPRTQGDLALIWNCFRIFHNLAQQMMLGNLWRQTWESSEWNFVPANDGHHASLG